MTGQVDELPNEEEWDLFWIDFKNAFDKKDKIKIVTLTSKQFFDGGGGETIEEWLNNIAFSKAYTEIKKDLAKGVKKINNENGAYYKATGQGEYGDLYFDYKNGTWQFGGIVGD